MGTKDVPVGLLESNQLPETMLNAVLPFGKANRLFHVTALRSNLNFFRTLFFFSVRTGNANPRRMNVGVSRPAQFGSFGIDAAGVLVAGFALMRGLINPTTARMAE